MGKIAGIMALVVALLDGAHRVALNDANYISNRLLQCVVQGDEAELMNRRMSIVSTLVVDFCTVRVGDVGLDRSRAGGRAVPFFGLHR